MVLAKCTRCGGSGTDSTFEKASSNINHAVGKTRGVPCGPSFNRVIQVGDTPKAKKLTSKPKVEKSPTPKPKEEKSSSPISEDTKE